MSFLKKLIKKKDEEKAEPAARLGMQAMPAELQLKYAKGVQYNMKIIIKGDRNVGKSTLFLRLQGQKFREEYLPTGEIQVANIQWNYKATDDVVKVEVWDVVDKGRPKRREDAGLKLEHSEEAVVEQPCLDAQFVDVYKGTHGVIMMYDITKLWTWQYVERELPKIPSHLPVIVLANHRDMGAHSTVNMESVQYFLESQDRGPDAASIRCAETSMLNGFGLKFLHRFFNLPFLKLQRDTLLKQLEANAREHEALNQELDLLIASDEHNYEKCLEAMNSQLLKKQSRTAVKDSPRAEGSSSPALLHQSSKSETSLARSDSPATIISPSSALPHKRNDGQAAAIASHSVDDFLPENIAEDTEFFEAEKRTPSKVVSAPVQESSDSDNENPMVAGFQDDIDSDDNAANSVTVSLKHPNVQLTSDEDDVIDQTHTTDGSDQEEDTLDRLQSKFTEKIQLSVTPGYSSSMENKLIPNTSQLRPHAMPLLLDSALDQPDIQKRVGLNMELSAPKQSLEFSKQEAEASDSEAECGRPTVFCELDAPSSDESPAPVQLIQSEKQKKNSHEKKPKKKKKTVGKKETEDSEGGVKPIPKKKKVKAREESTVKNKKSSSKTKDPLEEFLSGDVEGGYESF